MMYSNLGLSFRETLPLSHIESKSDQTTQIFDTFEERKKVEKIKFLIKERANLCTLHRCSVFSLNHCQLYLQYTQIYRACLQAVNSGLLHYVVY